MATTDEQLVKFWTLIDQGASKPQAARSIGVSLKTAYNIYNEQRGRHLTQPKPKRKEGKHFSQRPSEFRDGKSRGQEDLPDPRSLSDISDEAKHALEDFHYFSQRYFGRAPTPWRKDAADRVLELYESPDKEFAVINTPPGVGKTTLFTHDIPAWLTVRDRAIRGILGSWGITAGTTFTRTLRTSLERTALAPTSDDDIRKGVEFPTEGVLAVDFGRFKPLGQSDFWTATSFTVEQLDGRAPADKEPTWTAFGNGEIIGWRVNFLIFDDLVTTRKLDSEAEQKKMQRWWDQEVERRVEPGGLCLLEGQRLGANDHYRYCLDKLDLDEGDDIQGWDPDDPRNDMGPKKKYHHIVYKGHYEERCKDAEGEGSKHPDHHPKSAKPFPEGCLLDPHRCSYREQMRERATNPVLYSTVYQQDDTDPDQVLVPKVWIDGDEGHPGCWDSDRDSWEMPMHPDGSPKFAPPFITVVSVDPSPTKNWAVQSWVIHPASESYILLDLFRGQMEAPAFLYGEESTGVYTGMLEELRKEYARLGIPLRNVIFERNVAQRWFTQSPYVKAWGRKHQVRWVEHETTPTNKRDTEFGLTMLRPLFQHGQIRLPGKQVPRGHQASLYTGRRNAIKLVNELTRYSLQFGASGTDDQIMACWMMAHRAKSLAKPEVTAMPKLNPSAASWMSRVKNLVGVQ